MKKTHIFFHINFELKNTGLKRAILEITTSLENLHENEPISIILKCVAFVVNA